MKFESTEQLDYLLLLVLLLAGFSASDGEALRLPGAPDELPAAALILYLRKDTSEGKNVPGAAWVQNTGPA